jgi:hypothetical protein
LELEIPWRHKIKPDWSWKFLGGTKSNLIEAGNSLAARNQT